MAKPDAIFNVARVIDELVRQWAFMLSTPFLKLFSSKVLKVIDGRPTGNSVHVNCGAFKITISDNGCRMS